MKLVAIFGALPEHDRELTGEFHYLNTEDGHVLFVCEPHNYGVAEKHLQDLGGKVFPDLLGRETLPAEVHGHAAAKAARLGPSDTTYSALKKLMKHHGWPALDPRG